MNDVNGVKLYVCPELYYTVHVPTAEIVDIIYPTLFWTVHVPPAVCEHALVFVRTLV